MQYEKSFWDNLKFSIKKCLHLRIKNFIKFKSQDNSGCVAQRESTTLTS